MRTDRTITRMSSDQVANKDEQWWSSHKADYEQNDRHCGHYLPLRSVNMVKIIAPFVEILEGAMCLKLITFSSRQLQKLGCYLIWTLCSLPWFPASAAQCKAEVPSGVVVYTGILSSTSSLRSCVASPLVAHWCRRDVRTSGDDVTCNDTGRWGVVTPGGVVVEALLLRVTLGEPPSLEFPMKGKYSILQNLQVLWLSYNEWMPEILNVFEVERSLKNLLKITWKAFFNFIYLKWLAKS